MATLYKDNIVKITDNAVKIERLKALGFVERQTQVPKSSVSKPGKAKAADKALDDLL